MENLDFVLGGQLSRQRHQDALQWAEHERIAREAEMARHSQKTGLRRSEIAHHYVDTLLTLLTSLFRS